MSQSIGGKTRTFVAGGSINANKAVRVSTTEDNTVHLCTGLTTAAAGVALFSASDGDSVTVQLDGTVKCIALRAITIGGTLGCSTDGKAAHSSTANNKVLGIALEAVTSTAGTQLFEVDLTPKGSNF